MRAENLLFVLDECDELQVLLRESFRPSALGVLALLLTMLVVTWVTASLALGFAALVIGAWCGLSIAWVNERLVPQPVRARTNLRHD
ncbi:MAG: hypothetical protein AB8G16_10880 [Gammaproteobacteria bacterium]